MNYLKTINKSRSIYEGFKVMDFNFHLLDIMICNYYTDTNRWGAMADLFKNYGYYNRRFSEMTEFAKKYSELSNIIRKFSPKWDSPITLIYPTPYVDFAITDGTVDEMRDWLTFNYPTSSFNRKKIIKLYIPVIDSGTSEITGWQLITFRNDNDVWVRAVDDYRPRGC